MCWHYRSLFHSLGLKFYLYLRINSEPLKSGPKHQNYHQFHEKSSKWPIWLLIGHLGENSYFVGTVHTDSRIRRNGYFGLTVLKLMAWTCSTPCDSIDDHNELKADPDYAPLH
jgi:hypothetical protein